MAITVRDRDEILTKLRSDIQNLNTNINLGDHSVAYDIALYPASTLGADLWLLADFIARSRSTNGIISMIDDLNYKEQLRELFQFDQITEVEDLISSLLEALVGNWGITRKEAVKARVPVRFYSSTNSPITVQDGKRISTRGQNPITFVVQGGVVSGTPSFETARGLYFVEVMCEAETAGASGLVGEGTITVLIDNVSGVVQVRNPIASFGGADAENDLDLAARAGDAWQSWSLDTVGGLRAFFTGQPTVDDAYVAKPGDPLVGRNPQGAPTDVFIEAPQDPVAETDVFVLTDTIPLTVQESALLGDMFAIGNAILDGPQGIVYPPTTSVTVDHFLNRQPIVGVSSISGDTAGDLSFTLFEDTTLAFSGSTRSRSFVRITIPGVAVTSETITINYTYDSAILALQNTIDSPDNDLISQDILVRGDNTLYVNITGDVVTFQGDEFPATSAIQATIESDLNVFFRGGRASTDKQYSRFGLGDSLDRSDTLAVALVVDGVDRIDTWTVNVSGTTIETTFAPQNSEAFRLGTITWV